MDETQTPEPLFPVAKEETPEPMFPTTPAPPPVAASPTQVSTTASLAALAQQRNDPAAADKSMYELTEANKQRITNGQEDQLRQEASDAKKLDDQRYENQFQADLLYYQGQDIDKNFALRESMQKGVEAASRPSDPYTIEKEGVAQLVSNGLTDKTQAQVVSHTKPSFLQVRQDNAVFMLAWNKAVDQLQTEAQNEGWVQWAADFFTLPFQQMYQLGHTGIPGGDTGWTGAQRLVNDVNALNKLPLNQQLAAIPHIVDAVKANSGLFTVNHQLALQTFESLRAIDVRDEMGADLWQTGDLLTVLPLA